MAEQQCPLCKSDSYLNPNIKILISPCFHKLCEQCMHKLFSQGSAPCPVCQTPLRRINFMTSTFENIQVEKEVRVRRIMHQYFKRKPAEFSNSEEFDNYLEAFENLVFELAEYNTEKRMKERIIEITTQSESILNSTTGPKDDILDDLSNVHPAKCVKTESLAITEYLRNLPHRPSLTLLPTIQSDLFVLSPQTGVGYRDVIPLLMNSLFGE